MPSNSNNSLSELERDEKLCPRAGVQVTFADESTTQHMFAYVDTSHIAERSPDCERITRFVLGPTREAVLHFRRQNGPPEDDGGLNATCRFGNGPVLFVSEQSVVTQERHNQELLVPELGGAVRVRSRKLLPPGRIAFSATEAGFSKKDSDLRLQFATNCPEHQDDEEQ